MEVSHDAKYAAACQETVARLGARDNVLVWYVTLSAALITFSLTKDEFSLLGVAVGYTALAAALLSRHHDVIIGLLGAFQNALCENENDETHLNWFSDDYFDAVLRERGHRDLSLWLILAGAGIFGLGIASKHVSLCNFGELNTIIWYSSAASLLVSFYIVYWTHETRQRLHRKIHPHHHKLNERAQAVSAEQPEKKA